MSVVAIPKILIDRLTEEGARALVEIIDKVEEQAQKATLEIAEERFEKRIAQLDARIEKVRADIIQWMFIFWIGQVGSITAILFAFFRK
jgi:lipoate synthase